MPPNPCSCYVIQLESNINTDHVDNLNFGLGLGKDVSMPLVLAKQVGFVMELPYGRQLASLESYPEGASIILCPDKNKCLEQTIIPQCK